MNAAIEYFNAVSFAEEELGFHPDPRQAEVLDATIHRGILNCTRQWGKSTVTSIKAVHRAVTDPGSLTLILSPTSRQSAEFLRKASGFLSKLGIRPRGDGDNDISLLLPNGSRLVGLPGVEATVRGFSAVSLLLIDEAACVPDELYKAVRPMLAVGGGDLWLLSTPHGKRGFFYDAWVRGGSEWTRFRIPATECPRISPKFLEEEKHNLGSHWFRQEYLCEFAEARDSLFREDFIAALPDPAILPLFKPGTRGAVYEFIETHYAARFVIAVDLGQALDHSAIAVIEMQRVFTGETDRITYERKSKLARSIRHLERIPLDTAYTEVAERVREIARLPELAGRCSIVMDATGVGAPVVEMVRRAGPGCEVLPIVITSGEHESYGHGSRKVPKKDLVSALQLAMENKELRVAAALPAAETLLEEMRAMRLTHSPVGREKFAATAAGTHDDLVLAVALGNWWLPRKTRL